MMLCTIVLFSSSYSHALRAITIYSSDSYVVLEEDEKWKYWPLLRSIHHLVYSGATVPYGGFPERKELSLSLIDSMRVHREVVPVQDHKFPGEIKDSLVNNYTPIEDWYDGLVFTTSWRDMGNGKLKGDVVAVGLSYSLSINGYDYGSLSAYFLGMELFDLLSASEQKLLIELITRNCGYFSSTTRLYSKERALQEHPDSLFDLSLLKTRSFFDRNRLFFDQSLEEPIREFKQFDALLHTTDTLGLKWNTSYLWSYPKWLFFDHLVYRTHAEFLAENWQITLSWHSVGVSGQDRNKHSKSFYMSPETLQKEVSPLTWEQIKKDYLKGVLLGFERPTREP